MRFTYIGEFPPSGRLEAFGVVFTPGSVEEVPAQFERKCLGNRFFTRVEAEDGSGQDEEATVDLKPALIEAAKERGIKIDKRWSADRIAKALEEHD